MAVPSGGGEVGSDVPVDVAHARAVLSAGLLTVSLPRLRERRGQETVIPVEREPAE